MTQVINLDQIIAQKVKTLPPEQQQQILDFVDFLLSKTQKVEFKHSDGSPMSALEAEGDLVGCVEGGPGDLATTKNVFTRRKPALAGTEPFSFFGSPEESGVPADEWDMEHDYP